jgi:4-amino-4-deoxy-L-arabinose transferase-like glycosyltransferase
MDEAAVPASSLAAPSLARLARWPAVSLLVLCLIVWLPGALILPPLDRDESRFAQASKQMVETGDFVDIRFSSGARYNKPVGIYWLQAASTELFGSGAHDQIWTYRLPSLIGGYLALLLVFWCARAFTPPQTALAAAALLGASVLMTGETQIATTDAVLLAAILGTQTVLMRLYLAEKGTALARPGRGLVLAGWFAFAVGILVKGPVIAAVLGATLLALALWDRDWRWLKTARPIAGLLVAAAVVLPWMISIQIQSHGAFYRQSLGHDFANKLMSGQESHGAPPSYYLVLASLTLWPAILFVAPGLCAGLARRKEPAIRYLLAWAGASWLMFELVPTKLPHYILPAYPPLAILAALYAFAPQPDRETGWMRALRILAGIQFSAGLIAFLAITSIAPAKFGAGTTLGLVAISVAGTILGTFALWLQRVRDGQAALGLAIASAVVLIPLLTFGVVPRLDRLWISPRAATLVAKDRRPGDPPAVVAGYAEPSLVFLLGTQTQIVGAGADAAKIAARQGGLALIEDRERDAFLAQLGALDTQAFAVDSLAGYDYSRGRRMHITIYRVVASLQSTMPPAE